MKDLKTVECFGSIDADNDNILSECFEDHEAFTNVLDFSKFLIIGRKGSGKTAIFKKLVITKRSDFFSYGHTFSDYPWHYHDLQVQKDMPSFEKYVHSWKYLILLTVSKILLNQDQSAMFNDDAIDDLEKLESFVVDTYGTRDPDLTQVFTPSKRLRMKAHFDIDWKLLRVGISPEKVPMTELPTIIQDVNRNLMRCVCNCLNAENMYFVCFDQLDLGFDPENQEYRNRLIGLLLAVRDINKTAASEGKRLLSTVFLRDDIYDELHFEDKNKITDNCVSVINWDTKGTSKTLKGLMEKRFTKLLGDTETRNVTWSDIFDETKVMTGHQPKYKHILDRTYNRPRDIIKFCNCILDQFKHRHSQDDESKTDTMFTNEDINMAKVEFSDYLLSELDDELHKHIPKYRDYLEVCKSIGVVQFKLEQFEEAFKSKSNRFSDEVIASDVLRQLFKYSIIGYYRVGGRGYGGSEWVFKYEEQRAQFDETAQTFRVHYGLMEVLGLKRYSRAL